MRIPRELSDLGGHLARHADATSRPLLIADGFTDEQVARALRAGHLSRVRRGAYIAPPSGPMTELTPADRDRVAARAAVAVARTLPVDAALSHESALLVWGLPILGRASGLVHYVRPSRPAVTTRPGIVQHQGPEPACIVTLPQPEGWRGVRVVSRALAVVQVAVTCGVDAGVVAADAALHERRMTTAELVRACELSRMAFLGKAEALLRVVDACAESPGESLLRLEMLRLGLDPRSQVDLVDGLGFVGRVDFLVDGVVVEFDGASKYAGAAGQAALVAEKLREDRIRAMGFQVVRVVWDDLRRPGAVAAKLRAAGLPV